MCRLQERRKYLELYISVPSQIMYMDLIDSLVLFTLTMRLRDGIWKDVGRQAESYRL